MLNNTEPSDRRLRIALFSPYGSITHGADGGGASYEKAIARVLDGLKEAGQFDLLHVIPSNGRINSRVETTVDGTPVLYYKPSIFERIFSSTTNPIFTKLISRLGLLRTEETLKAQGVNLVYFSSPSSMALRLETLPYIFTVWDLGHRDLAGFPEMAAYREWVFRERLYSIAVGRAFHVMVDSASTGKRLEALYGLDQRRWSAIGLVPQLPSRLPHSPLTGTKYVIYPAARWPHKNHLTLLRAWVSVVEKHPNLKLVLTGKDEGFGERIRETVVNLGLERSVIDVGYVSKEESLALIAGAELLVMPTLLGPTNLPPLEALALGVPALVSDVHNYGTEVDDLVTKIPATDSEAWSTAISTAISNGKKAHLDLTLEKVVEAHLAVLQKFQLIGPLIHSES